MWSQAIQNHLTLLDLTQYGWKVVEGRLVCDWESSENQTAIRERVGLLFRGCSCSSATACSIPAVVVVSRRGADVVLAAGARTAAILLML